MYYIVACVFYCNVETVTTIDEDSGDKTTRHWTIDEALYFTTVTLTTVGYGDFAPKTDGGKLFTIIFIFLGLSVVFQIFSEIASLALAAAEAATMKAADDNPDDNSDPHFAKVAMSVGMILFFVFLSSFFFYFNEEFLQDGEKDFLNAFYWSFVTVTTVGYGDMAILKESSRIFSIFFIIVAVLVVATAIGNFSAVAAAMAREKKELDILNNLTAEDLMNMDEDEDGLTEAEYILGMLKLMESVDPKLVDRYKKEFRSKVEEVRNSISGSMPAEEVAKDGEARLTIDQLKALAKKFELDKIERMKKLQNKSVAVDFFVKPLNVLNDVVVSCTEDAASGVEDDAHESPVHMQMNELSSV
uniref:Potassium channel domain-containing protein n=1 Tax=Octactis speculum TaxID=3111310 RepID=A0A7S2DFV6_9STRA